MNYYYIGAIQCAPYLEHHGILGMKWGIRRYQNEDGTLTEAGRRRYGTLAENNSKKDLRKRSSDFYERASEQGRETHMSKVVNKVTKEVEKTQEYKNAKALNDYMNQMKDEVEALYGKGSQIVIGKDDAEWFNEQMRKAQKKSQEILKKYEDEAAKAFLKDLNYEDTEAGREFVKQFL